MREMSLFKEVRLTAIYLIKAGKMSWQAKAGWGKAI
jgi:hypothetical protein